MPCTAVPGDIQGGVRIKRDDEHVKPLPRKDPGLSAVRTGRSVGIPSRFLLRDARWEICFFGWIIILWTGSSSEFARGPSRILDRWKEEREALPPSPLTASLRLPPGLSNRKIDGDAGKKGGYFTIAQMATARPNSTIRQSVRKPTRRRRRSNGSDEAPRRKAKVARAILRAMESFIAGGRDGADNDIGRCPLVGQRRRVAASDGGVGRL